MTATEKAEFYREALLRLLATMFAAAGIVPGGEPVLRLARPVRSQILRVLLPIESAARRLIYFRARRLEAITPEAPSEESATDGKRKNCKQDGTRAKRKGTRPPVFALFDKQKYFPELTPHKTRYLPGPGPRISFFDDRDAPREPVVEKPPRDPDNAVRLCRRMQALMRALQDMDAQARRLRRIIDKRKAENAPPAKTDPMRPGHPPGHRVKGTHEVDEFLNECDLLARRPPPKQDSS